MTAPEWWILASAFLLAAILWLAATWKDTHPDE